MIKTYEYLAIDIIDRWGSIDPELITEKLNELGADGWHLVTAYANELGKNAITALNIKFNSTSDQNIFIFEKEVLKESPLEIEQRKAELRKQQEEIEKQKIEELKKSIKNYDDLLNDPKIKEEADTLLKFYGKDAYQHYLEKKASELGLEK